MQVPPFAPPKEGDMVGDYRIVGVLGEGGFGYVYKVERAGLFFALKLLRARALDKWGQREINILRHLQHPNVVGFHGCDRWPIPLHGYLYFVMEYVEGRTLEDWALDENPSARHVARVLLEVLRALAAVHQQGVFHRDLKRDNILIRDSDARPILVDFGIGWLAGEPTLTRDTLPPGTCEYRSPEALRFEKHPANEGARYRPDEGDDLWALAVTLYWLLTELLPFGNRHEGGLNERILTLTPRAPHELNSRVPEALSRLCMRMLEKERSARFANCDELCRALEAALSEADGHWDLPLVDPEAPDKAPTEQDPARAPRDVEALEFLQWNVLRPRRGRKAARKPLPEAERLRTPVVAAPAPPPAEPPQAGDKPAQVDVAEGPAPSVEALAALLADAPAAPGGAASPPVPEAAGPASPPASPPAPAASPSPRPAPASVPAASPPPAAASPRAPVRGRSRLLPARAGMLPVGPMVADMVKPAARAVAALALVALAGAAAFVVRPRTSAEPTPAPGSTAKPMAGAHQPQTWWTDCPTPRACPVLELAASPETAEAGGGAAPVVAPTPALANVMPLRKQESRVPPQEKPAPQPQAGLCRKWRCLAASCGWALVACTSGPQVRATPGPEDCPADAVKTMEDKLNLPLGTSVGADIPPGGLGRLVTARSGEAAVELVARYGQLPEGTLLTGEFILGKDRLYGRFTRAQTPQGRTYPVCMEIKDTGGVGSPLQADAGSDAARVYARVRLYAVSSFGDKY